MEAAGILIFVLIRAILGAIAAAIARAKGRSAVGWFFGGFFLDLIGIIIVAVLPNKKKEQLKDEHAESERRRLREQLRQERMKNEAMRQHVTHRLDTHDQALGLDTRGENPMLEAGGDGSPNIFDQSGESQQPQSRRVTTGQESAGPRWYYARDGKTQGPYSAAKMEQMRENGTIDRDCWVMPVGGSTWRPMGEVGSFHSN